MSTLSKRVSRICLVLCAVLFAALAVFLPSGGMLVSSQALSAETALHAIDVGQGDSILLTDNGQAVLIDAGDLDHADTVVQYLQNAGISKLYAVVATHPHDDHIGGMAAVIDSFPIEHFFMTTRLNATTSYENMLGAMERANITPEIPSPGEVLTLPSGASLTFLWPAQDDDALSLNDSSIVCLFDTGNSRVLLMGDAEDAAEQALIQQKAALSCDIIKLGHHGSDTSSSLEFLRSTGASTAIISCGRDNSYGHPSPKTLENLKQAGITDVRNTAEEGTVFIRLDL